MKMKKILCVVLALSAIFCLASCFSAKEKTFSKEGLTITLTDAFKEKEMEGFAVAYDSPTVAVFAIKEGYDLFDDAEDMTLEEYGALVYAANSSKTKDAPAQKNGVYCMEYDFTNPEENESFHYVVAVYKGSDAFWTISIACRTDDFSKLESDMFAYAKSVKVD